MTNPTALDPSVATPSRRRFNRFFARGPALAVSGWFPALVRAQPAKLKVGVLLPKSGVPTQLGQSFQRGADISIGIVKEMYGVDTQARGPVDGTALADAIRRTKITDRLTLGGLIVFNTEDQNPEKASVGVQNRKLRSQVVLPAASAETTLVLPVPARNSRS